MRFQVITDINELQPINDAILIPILQDKNNHRCINPLSFIYVYSINTGEEYIINVGHSDYKRTLNLPNITNIFLGQIYIYNKSYLYKLFPDSIDVNLIYWLEYNEAIANEYTSEINIYHRWYAKNPNINNIIPMMNWLIYCRNINAQIKFILADFILTSECTFYNKMLNNLYKLEDSGIFIDQKISKKYLPNISSSTLYSQYNLYTSTGRPSNHYNSINFAALNKRTGIRSIITSRFKEDGRLIEWDFESMHVRLAASLIGVDLPSGNLHEYFGRYYFKTPVLDEETYVKSKNITWQLLYGNIEHKYIEIPFFKSIHEYRKNLWIEFKRNGYITMPLSNKKIQRKNFPEKMTANILFNYVLQGYETEYNSLMLDSIFKYLYKKQSKLILYTYDSFLFDFNKNDGKQFIDDINAILNVNNMRTVVKLGKNYHSMKQI